MIKRCPIMSKQTESHSKVYCFGNECALWDEAREQCCILTQALAAVGKPSGRPNISQQAEYVYSITPAPVVAPNNSSDWIKLNPCRIDCSLEKGV